MSIKGTLETFNLCELLQMLAFNRKAGTLVLEAEGGPRAICLETGCASLARDDPHLHASLTRIARHALGGDHAAIQKALEAHERSGEDVARILQKRGVIDAPTREAWVREALTEQLLGIQLTPVSAFEFAEGKVLRPDGQESEAASPAVPVESLLLDLARRLDHWNAVCETVPSPREVYEGTGIGVDLGGMPMLDPGLTATVIPLIDGRRSLTRIADESHTTIYAVTEIAAALFEGGGIRAVPTDELIARAEDMLAGGEAAEAVPLLRRSIERGDAPLEARLRLADALEASGQGAAAAAELDTFAALSDDEHAGTVFEALTRSLALRGGELATALRVCDYYLRRRPWLREYVSHATRALRDLIHAASTERRPLDAAHRLAAFIKAQDAPSEDLLLLADLYEAGGEAFEAASALVRRAEDLLAADRVGQARSLLHRALDVDPGHADAKRRLVELDGAKRLRLHRTRMALLAVLTLVVVAGAGAAWWFYRQAATKEVGGARELAELAVEDTERKAREAIDQFKERLEAAVSSADEDPGLADAAEAMRATVQTQVLASQRAVAAYTAEIETYAATGRQEAHRNILRGLEQRRAYLTAHATAVISDLAGRAREALQAGRRENTDGNFTAARRHYRLARNLSIQDPDTHARALQFLEYVDGYFATFEGYRDRMEAATERGALAEAFAIGRDALRELEDSDLTRSLAFPLAVTTRPPGAEVWIGPGKMSSRTPCVVRWSPFDASPIVRVRLPGRRPAQMRLPSFGALRHGDAGAATWDPTFAATLPVGTRWQAEDPAGGFTALWASGSVAMLSAGRGRTVGSVDPRSGAVVQTARLDERADAIRMGGNAGHVEWRVHGQQTLVVQPASGQAWSMQALGRIEHAPLFQDGVCILVDAIGAVYAYEAGTGSLIWRQELGVTPSQSPMPSALGVLIATTSGTAWHVASGASQASRLAPSVSGPLLAVPFDGGALLIGGGVGGLRLVGPGGDLRVLGDASPQLDRAPFVGPHAVAWIEEGAVRVLKSGEVQPAPASGLGLGVARLGGNADALLAVDAAGNLRAVRLGDLRTTVVDVPLGAPARADPLALGDAAYVLTDAGLVAIEI